MSAAELEVLSIGPPRLTAGLGQMRRLDLTASQTVFWNVPELTADELISMAARAYTSSPYTSLMAMTTIRVEAEIRDRLAARASEHGRSLGAELKAMLDEMMWQGIEAGYRRLAADQEEMAAYQAEAAEWTSADIGNLAASAAEEYPEYNS